MHSDLYREAEVLWSLPVCAKQISSLQFPAAVKHLLSAMSNQDCEGQHLLLITSRNHYSVCNMMRDKFFKTIFLLYGHVFVLRLV